MTASSIFFSSCFDERDKPIVQRLDRLLRKWGVMPVFSAYPVNSAEKTIPMIQQHELYCALISSNSSKELLDAVSLEVRSALSLKLKVIVFRDVRVPAQADYPAKIQVTYDPNLLAEEKHTEFPELTAQIQELLTLYGLTSGDAPVDAEILRRYAFAREQSQVLGSTILRYYNDVFYPNLIRNKAIKNFPTHADITANRMITSEIRNVPEFRHDAIISEEDTKDSRTLKRLLDGSKSNDRFTWVIDPLDGTLNFAYNFPYFCVSIGVLQGEEPVIGIVFNPTTQELYCGLKGKRSECFDLRNGQKRFLNTDYQKSELEDCIVMSHLSTNAHARRKTISVLDPIMTRCRNVRMLGSGQMSLVSIALSQFDIFFNYSTNLWDVIPGAVILSGAGGYTTTSLIDDSSWNLKSKGILAAGNAAIGKQIKDLIFSELGEDFPQH